MLSLSSFRRSSHYLPISGHIKDEVSARRRDEKAVVAGKLQWMCMIKHWLVDSLGYLVALHYCILFRQPVEHLQQCRKDNDEPTIKALSNGDVELTLIFVSSTMNPSGMGNSRAPMTRFSYWNKAVGNERQWGRGCNVAVHVVADKYNILYIPASQLQQDSLELDGKLEGKEGVMLGFHSSL